MRHSEGRMKAIETSYKGCRFRSRLEARWAVFFDAVGIAWQYEPQGFVKEDGPGGRAVCYLPDFFLPDSGLWVEVKGTDDALYAEAAGIAYFLDYGSPLPGFDDSEGTDGRMGLKLRGLLFLGDVPDPTRWGLHLHPLVQHHKGLRWSLAAFVPGTAGGLSPPRPVRVTADGDLIAELALDNSLFDWEDGLCGGKKHLWRVRSEFVPTHYSFQNILDAYKAARSARFEHGETPRV